MSLLLTGSFMIVDYKSYGKYRKISILICNTHTFSDTMIIH